MDVITPGRTRRPIDPNNLMYECQLQGDVVKVIAHPIEYTPRP